MHYRSLLVLILILLKIIILAVRTLITPIQPTLGSINAVAWWRGDGSTVALGILRLHLAIGKRTEHLFQVLDFIRQHSDFLLE
jgi:hypothetical protein